METRELPSRWSCSLEDPVLAAVLVDLDVDDRPVEMHFGQHHAADEERQQLDAGLHRVGLEHQVVARPVGVGECNFFSAKARMYPAPDRLQAAVDDQLATGGVR